MKYKRLIILALTCLVGLLMFQCFQQWFKRSFKEVAHGRISVRMRGIARSVRDYYECHGQFPHSKALIDCVTSETVWQDMMLTSFSTIDPETVLPYESTGLNTFGNMIGADFPIVLLRDPRFVLLYKRTVDGCVLALTGWDSNLEVDLNSIQSVIEIDSAKYQYDPSNGTCSQGDYIELIKVNSGQE